MKQDNKQVYLIKIEEMVKIKKTIIEMEKDHKIIKDDYERQLAALRSEVRQKQQTIDNLYHDLANRDPDIIQEHVYKSSNPFAAKDGGRTSHSSRSPIQNKVNDILLKD